MPRARVGGGDSVGGGGVKIITKEKSAMWNKKKKKCLAHVPLSLCSLCHPRVHLINKKHFFCVLLTLHPLIVISPRSGRG